MRKLILMAAFIIAAFAANSANIQVTNAGLTAQDSTASPAYTKVKFNLAWDAGWRMSGGPANWDAAWIFVKYKLPGQDWKHATLSNDPADYAITSGAPAGGMTFLPGSDGKGVFLHRTTNGTGAISLTDVLLRWDYGTDLVANNAQVRVQVFAIEMVWVPKGPFFIGDGNMTTAPSNTYTFRRNNSTGMGYMPYLVNSESAIIFAATGYSGTDRAYDPWLTAGYTLPASYPKGYDGFYCMKYEISQEQYADFFNTLPNTAVRSTRNIAAGGSYRNNWSWSGTYTDDIATASYTGRWRACNFLHVADGLAYADWAALRPMTELEYEKACRGTDNTDTNNRKPIFPTNTELPWGNATYYQLTTTPTSDGLVNEYIATTGSYNINFGATTPSGVVRCGMFAYRTGTWPSPVASRKMWAGASYYGILELAGNVREATVMPYYYYASTGYNVPSYFNGQNGDGLLNANANANVPGWIISGQTEIAMTAATCYWLGFRGGSWNDAIGSCYVSSRDMVKSYSTSRTGYEGMRLARKP
jgi:formylglycine-generating enzyme required for sulfatase activity